MTTSHRPEILAGSECNDTPRRFPRIPDSVPNRGAAPLTDPGGGTLRCTRSSVAVYTIEVRPIHACRVRLPTIALVPPRRFIVPDPQFPDELVILDFVMRTSDGGREPALADGTGHAAHARRRR